MNGVVVKSVDEAAVHRAMDAYACRLLSAHPEVEEIVVFGSFAEGNWSPGSDLDVFVVLSHSSKAIRERIPELLPGAFPVGVDLFPYTPGGDRRAHSLACAGGSGAEPLALHARVGVASQVSHATRR